jgi:uncharacterized protein YgiM (DUF1202 family)
MFRNDSMRRPSGTLIAAAACVAAIALAGLALIFLQAPGSKTTRPAPAENAALPAESPPAAQLPERPGARQQPAGARSETSASPGSGMLPAQAPAGSTSQSREPARADGVVPPDARIATPAPAPPPALAPTAPQQNNALRPNPEHRQIVTLERSGVNIRSAPSANSRVVGSAPKGTRFEVKQRKGRWVEIESNEVRGWVSPRFLGPDQPVERR